MTKALMVFPSRGINTKVSIYNFFEKKTHTKVSILHLRYSLFPPNVGEGRSRQQCNAGPTQEEELASQLPLLVSKIG